eukprot:CAMPEP_0179309984 /NCGR_PEP_ID=MMETSP0797-20121207/51932_1 /TAXON_ID=47934 /ORGANISM="Dinophysis acuminata, Strain DAEP01" /LENGTH=724 /DNA_ID=CAMNT_0021019703 /DNA_START=102 /DNA_END=2276 /DNA_ORIENTATION=-
MSPQTRRKIKALFFIAMMAVADGQKINEMSAVQGLAGTMNQKVSSGSGAHDLSAKLRSLAGTGSTNQESLHLLFQEQFEDPGFRHQLEAMAGQMQNAVDHLKKDPAIQSMADEITNELAMLSANVRAVKESTLPRLIHDLIQTDKFLEHAEVFAEETQKSLKETPDVRDSEAEVQEILADMEVEQTSNRAAESFDTATSDPKFQRHAARVSNAVESFMQDPDLVSQATSLAEHILGNGGDESSVGLDLAFGSNGARVSREMNEMLANERFKGMASDLVLEMLREEDAPDTEWLASLSTEELLEIQQNTDLLNSAAEQHRPASARRLFMGAAPHVRVQGERKPWIASAHSTNPGLLPRMLPKGTRGGALYAGADGSALTSEEGLKGQVGAIADALPKAGDEAAAKKKLPVDFGLFVVLALWYLGNYYYNITNKLALNAAGGAAGFPMTIATLQFGVGALYAIFLWLAPDARETPKISFKDWVKMGPVSIANTGAHAASVFALSAGSVSFAQIVKAAEPAFAAVIGTTVYKTKVSKAKWLALIPVIGGVCLASLGELNFAWAALITAGIANIFAAIKGNENKKLMETPGLKDRIGTVGNQFALTTITSFLFALPLMLIMEGHKLGEFFTLATTTPAVLNNLVLSGLWFYSYNELATIVVKKTNAVTQSVANTAKRVIVIVVVALVMGEGLSPLKLAGSTIGIAGVFLYSIIDKLVESRKEKKALVV